MSKFDVLNTVLSRRRIIKSAGALAAGIAAPTLLRVRSALAAYPERPVKIVVPNSPGGPSDIVGRITAAALQQSTGKTFIIENRGGGGANIGIDYAAHAEADGYTILVVTSGYSVNVGLFNKLPFDPYKDFVGVSELATSPNCFRGQIRATGKNDEGIRRARQGQSGEVQRLDAADRLDGVDPSRSFENPREAAQDGGYCLQRRR